MSGRARPRPLRVLVVDDEPLAREGLLALLAAEDDIEVVGQAGDGATAITAARCLTPDLLLLDVSMPEVDGFEVLAALGAEAPPDTIFVTAHDHYAVRAFDVNAVDYLLKPVSRERFTKALQRARERLRRGAGATPRLVELGRDGGLEAPDLTAGPARRLAVRSTGRVRFVRSEAIDWIEAADYYSRLHTGGRSVLIRESMKSLAERLDPRRFVRIHRSAIVNVDRVVEVQTRLHGGHTVTLGDGTRLPLSRSRRRALKALMGKRHS
jgi:two-component system LytT family response regulator